MMNPIKHVDLLLEVFLRLQLVSFLNRHERVISCCALVNIGESSHTNAIFRRKPVGDGMEIRVLEPLCSLDCARGNS